MTTAARPFDPPLTEKGEEQVRCARQLLSLLCDCNHSSHTTLETACKCHVMQARSVANKLKQYDIKQVYISPFYRCE